MIERIIAVLGSKSVGLELTNFEIADILWLAVQMQRKSAPSSLQAQPVQPTLPETPVIPSQSNKNTDSQKPSTSEEKSTNIYPQSPASNSNDSTESSGLPIKVPSPQALRNQLALARSLKPLKRRVPSRTTYVIDEGATAQRIAEEKLWVPVMRPAPERWLEVALVIDDSPSMMLWKQTIKEFRQLLERHGAFRDVRTWELSIDTNEKVLLRPSSSAQKRFHSPKELIEPNGRRLFVVISDCVSPAWRSGAITKALSVWANTSPMAILQVLPEWLWERSALGIAESVLLRSLAPGVPNQQLITKALDLLDDVTNSLKIPVVSLEPESLQTWARMVAGAGDIQTKGFLFAANAPILNNAFAQPDNFGASLSAKQRLQRFRLSASPMARQLAGLMAAVPVSLPIVRLIQQTMLPQSSQVHVAEVFLGGILKPLSDINVDIEPDNLQYEFFDGVRDLLLDSVPISLSAEVVRNISDYIAKQAGLSVDSFTAILVNPTSAPDALADVLVRPFARIAAKVLRRLGGKYVRVAEELEMYSVIPFQTNTSTVLTDQQAAFSDKSQVQIDKDINIIDFKLTGLQYRQFAEALLEAFPSQQRLAELVKFNLGKNLNVIAMGTDLKEIVFKLIQASQAEGWTDKLIAGARESNPHNPTLFAFAQEFNLAISMPSQLAARGALERLIKKTNRSLDINTWREKLGRIETQVCRIEFTKNSNIKEFGTGFLIAPNVVMTNYHVIEAVDLENANPNNVILRFDYKQLGNGKIMNKGTEYKLLEEDWLIDKSPYTDNPLPTLDELDYALLRVDGTPGEETVSKNDPQSPTRGWIELPTQPYEFSLNTSLCIVQHPKAYPLKLAFDTEAIIGINENSTTVKYKTNTEPGSSGSPCFDINWHLVALHHSGDPEWNPTYNAGTPISTICERLQRQGLLNDIRSGQPIW